MDKEAIRKNLEKVGRKFSDQKILELQKKHQMKMKEEKCGICQKNFSDEDIQVKKYAVEFSCPPPSDNRYFHPDCLELKKFKK